MPGYVGPGSSQGYAPPQGAQPGGTPAPAAAPVAAAPAAAAAGSPYPVSAYPVQPAKGATATPAQISQWAAGLRAAMKGMGTNEGQLIEIICPRSYEELAGINKAYTTEIKRDLIKDLKDETSGLFEDVLTSLLTDRYEYDAHLVMKAVKGMGTDEGMLAEVLCTRYPDELKQIGEAFMRLYKVDMTARVLDDVGGDLKRLYKMLLTSPRENNKPDTQLQADVQTLFSAGEGKWGTNEQAFINVICGSSRQYCEKLFYAYARLHGKSLDRAILNEIGGDTGRTLAMLVTPLEFIYAKKFHESMAGGGTKDHMLIRLVVTQRRGLKAVGDKFLQENQKTLAKWVESECSGDYKKALLRVLHAYC
jgi:hypothetical protein